MSDSPLVRAWRQTYRAQTDQLGEELYATVGTVQAKAIVSELTMDQILAAGGTAQNGGFDVQMLQTDFPTLPEKQQPVTTKGIEGLQVLNVNVNNGILYLQAGDFVAQE